MLTCLTLLFIAAQFSLFLIHAHVSDLIDSLVNASIALQMLHSVVLLPALGFLVLQAAAYALFIGWLWFISISIGELFKLSKNTIYWLGIFLWFLACFSLFALNQYYFPDSFFAGFKMQHSDVLLIVSVATLSAATLFAYINFFYFKRYKKTGSVILLLILCVAITSAYNLKRNYPAAAHAQPNIIFIGLDSLRPDFTGFYGNKTVHTSNVDKFLNDAAVFSQAYTPLARTFPAWVSILTAQYPKHNGARNNLVEAASILKHETLAKKLQQAGYTTVYATDEKRFSNITEAYGFDRIIGPNMGVNDFLLGGLSDFPLSNLLVNLPIGRFLFPFNYGNRAAAITYNPETFLQLVKSGVANLPDKPVFMAIHLCLSHWPFTWANKGHPATSNMADQYRASVQGVDKQFGEVLEILKKNGLLENSLVVVLSDHGTGLGLRGDRVISEANYQGKKQGMKVVSVNRLSSAPPYSMDKKRDYTINTSYGQATNVLSLTQNHIVLAFKCYGNAFPQHQINDVVSLLDISPTILDVLGLPPFAHTDGNSLRPYFSGKVISKSRPFFMETGDSMAEIETDHIYIEKVLKRQIGVYSINPVTGLLTMNPPAAESIIKNKQLAVMYKDWILAHYPVSKQKNLEKDKGNKMVFKTHIIPPYYVLVNLKTGKWTTDLSSGFAKAAPVKELSQRLKGFYSDELPSK